MKLIFNYLLSLILALLISGSLQAAKGCCRKSYYVVNDGMPDNKVLTPVKECNCPCNDFVDHQGHCKRCNHYGSPERASRKEYEPYYGQGMKETLAKMMI